MMISSRIPHFMNKFVYSVWHCSALKGTLKQAHPKPYQVQQKSRLKENVPLKNRFPLPLKFQSTLQLVVVSLTMTIAATAYLELVKGLSGFITQ